jgi:hypothetical protein
LQDQASKAKGNRSIKASCPCAVGEIAADTAAQALEVAQMQLETGDEAIEWAKRCPNPMPGPSDTSGIDL